MTRFSLRMDPILARSMRFALLVAILVGVSTARAGLTLYYTTDESATHDMPTDLPGDPWTKVGDDDAATITLGHRDKIWFAARNELDEGRDKHVGLRITAPSPQAMDALQPCKGAGEEEAEGFMFPDDSPPPVRTVFAGGKRIGNKYAANYRMTPQPTWERFCFKCVSPAGIDADFQVELFTSCASALDLPPLSAFFSMANASFGAPGAMNGEPRYTEVWVFPRAVPIAEGEPASIVAPFGTGPWFVEPVLTDPEGIDRPLGGFRYLSDGLGLTVHDRFDLLFAMSEPADMTYDLFGLDVEQDRFDRLTIERAPWSDDFDDLRPGPLHEIDGWRAWDDDDIAAGAEVSAEQAVSLPHAVVIDQDDGAVQQYRGYTEGVWAFSTKQYVPAAADTVQTFELLNTYVPGGPKSWSLRLLIDAASSIILDMDTGDTLPLVTDAWVDLRVVIDLDRNHQIVTYNGQMLVSRNWISDDADGPGVPKIEAVHLNGNGSPGEIHYDDLGLTRMDASGACAWEDGSCDVVAQSSCEALGGVYGGHGSGCCPLDLNQDGAVGPADLAQVLDNWGPNPGHPADFNGNGVVGPEDLALLLDTWGPCS